MADPNNNNSNGSIAACNDDISNGVIQQSQLINVPVTGGVTYHIMVGGYGSPAPFSSSQNGTATFHLSGPAPSLQPSLAASPGSLAFNPVVPAQSSASQPVTLTASLANVSSIVINATGNYSQSNTCPATLNAGSTCTVNVTFSPVQSGLLTGSLTVTSNATNSPATVSLTGDGHDPFTIQLTRPVRPTKSGNQLVVTAGANLEIPVQVAGNDSQGGFVTLSCENVPRGVRCSTDPAMLQLSQSPQVVRMVLSLGRSSARASRLDVAADGVYMVRLVARMGNLSKSIDVPVLVKAGPPASSRSRRLMP